MEEFIRTHGKIKGKSDLDPLIETLRLYDLLNQGSISRASLKEMDIGIEEFIDRRIKGIPAEYILGQALFRGNIFKCTGATLIPTPETGMIVDLVTDLAVNKDNEYIIMDIGTGCGNLAISLALEMPGSMIHATDISPEAIEITKRNIDIFNLKARIKTHVGDLFSPFKRMKETISADFIVTNPPYLPTSSIMNLPKDIRDNEPVVAFDGGPFGTDFFVRLFDEAPGYLKKDGYLITEIGEGQDRLVRRIAKKSMGNYKVTDASLGDSVRFMILKKIG